MPDTTVVVALVVGLAVLLVALFVIRSRGKKEEPPRFEAPRELAKRPPKEKDAAKADAAPSSGEPTPSSAPPKIKTPPIAFPAKPASASVPTIRPPDDDDEATRVDASPPSREEIDADQILSSRSAADTARPPAATPPPMRRSDPNAAVRAPSTSDATVADEREKDKPLPSFALEPTPTAPKIGTPASEPKLKLPASEPKLKLPASEPRVAQAKPTPKLPTSEPKVPVAAKAEPAKVEPKPLPTSEAKVPAAKPPPDDHDFSALNDAPAKAAAAAEKAAATAAKFAPPPNPATADLEKNDPRHAAARRLARVSVSEIKLYHEDEVKAGRAASDLWKRLAQDIALAKQTFEARVTADVRDRFDYLLDEIVRQLAEGDPKKLGPDAPTLKAATAAAAAPAAPAATPTPAKRPEPGADIVDEAEAPTKTVHKTLPEEDLKATAPVAVPERPAPTPAAEKPKIEATTPAADAKAAGGVEGKPTGIAARGIPSNPETAELEKNDPRHAAARRLARLSVSEIKLYHEDEVKAGRAANDLWKRMITDIGLATQTFDKRVDKDVRERFDYLYDEILRQLAEGDVAKLGPNAPKPKKAAEAAPPVAAPPPVAEPEPAPPPAPVAVAPAAPASEPKATPVSEPKVAAAAPVAVAEAPVAAPAPTTPAAVPTAMGRYAPPTNPATADLEKNDPRHAAARRLARLSVSEIKLYHEDEVKAGRDAKDLWKRLISDIGLATQTYEKRVDKEVRERFDYLYDEILRQLAEGDVAKLGPDAPKPKVDA